MGYALNLCKFHIYHVPYNHNATEEGMEITQNRIRIVDVADTLGPYRIILSADTASEVRQLLSRKRPCPACAGRRIGQHPAYRAAHAAGGDAGSCCRGDLLQLLCLLCCGTGPSGPESRAVPECQPSGAVLAVKSGRKQNSN